MEMLPAEPEDVALALGPQAMLSLEPEALAPWPPPAVAEHTNCAEATCGANSALANNMKNAAFTTGAAHRVLRALNMASPQSITMGLSHND